MKGDSGGQQHRLDDHMQFISDGIMELDFHGGTRIIQVKKFRGSDFRTGAHALHLSGKGMDVFPRVIPASHALAFDPEIISSGVTEIDMMLHGGLERGTVSLLTGPSGVGKTTLSMLFMNEAAKRGERSVHYTFEESPESIKHRCSSIGIPASEMINKGNLSLVKIESLQYTTGELDMIIRREVEERNTRVVAIDSLAGYRLALKGDDFVSHFLALSRYLANMGVTVLLVNEMEAITGDFRATEVGISYLADNIIFLRYLEIGGELRKAMGVLKKRLSSFENHLREFEITPTGVCLGKPLIGLRGILSGTPTGLDNIRGGTDDPDRRA